MPTDVESSINQQKDEEVAKRVQQGDANGFGILIDRYEPKLRRYARKFLFDREDADDLLQDVFIKVYTNIKSFDLKRSFSPWIYRIAHNEFVNALKKRMADKIIPFDFDLLFPHPIAKETADELANHSETRTMLNKYLSKIDAKYREPLVLYYFEELDYKEITEIMQLPQATVGVRLKRGRQLLKGLIEKNQTNEY